MKKLFNYLNSFQMLIGLFISFFAVLCVFLGVIICIRYQTSLIVTILVSAFCLFGGVAIFMTAKKFLVAGINIVRNYTKKERDEMGDLILGRVQNGEYL